MKWTSTRSWRWAYAAYRAARQQFPARQVPESANDDLVVEVAAALELVRALDIVEQVRIASIGGHDNDMPTRFQAGYQLACEEIAERLKPAAPAAAGAEEEKHG